MFVAFRGYRWCVDVGDIRGFTEIGGTDRTDQDSIRIRTGHGAIARRGVSWNVSPHMVTGRDLLRLFFPRRTSSPAKITSPWVLFAVEKQFFNGLKRDIDHSTRTAAARVPPV